MKLKSIIFTASLILSSSHLCMAETELHISTGFTSPVSDFYRSVLSEADNRMSNVSIKFEELPAERSLVLANKGINDGECCRIPAVITKEYTNLYPIGISFFTARFSAFSQHNKTDIKSFDDLKPFSVGTVKGWKIAVININKVQPQEIHIVTTPEQLIEMIKQNRIDYGVVGYLSGLQSISSTQASNVRAIEPPLIEKELYLLLHKKHKHLISDFDDTFESMKKDGTIDRIYNKLIESLTSQ